MEEDNPEETIGKGDFSVVVLLRLLNQPLYMRSIAHLEQLLNLLEVIMTHAESDADPQNKALASTEQQSVPEGVVQDIQVNNEIQPVVQDAQPNATTPTGEGSSSMTEKNAHAVLTGLPHAELRLLCSLLAREGLKGHFLPPRPPLGTAILRVLQALGSLVSVLHDKKDPQLISENEYSGALFQVSEVNSSLESLWLELSSCISKIESSSDSTGDVDIILGNLANVSSSSPLPAGSQNILPYIESFFVTCEKLHPGQLDVNQELVIATASDLEDVSTSGQKTTGFSVKVDENPVRISVRRAYILEDSYNQLRMRSPQDLKGRLTVHFQGEEGIDAGGLTREWYQLLSRVIFDKGALLFTTVGNESTFQPNPNSVYQTEHLSYFKLVKRYSDGQLLSVHFTRSFYKHILGVKVTYHDIEAIDPDYYKNLKWMLENDISDVLDLTFSVDADEEKLILYEKAEVTDYELIADGRNTRVTEESKRKFQRIDPRELISIFNDRELELLISGLPDIDLDDLRANTEYSGYSNASPIIQWFWDVLQVFSKEDKARFLQFVTGTSKVPLEGFSALQGISGAQRFQIHKAYGSPNHLPSAHTCFNQLDLPEYPSKEQLHERLLLAIHEGSEGFGFG
ncbi:hypothetical protein HPP92_024232 [Vanilla planifolia]|uniref:HECT-type E3 ubiquitin transferase n=1 Tax=Vanilla planifolia TaxID=51239 RepID=A0A835UB52_VANPL|nr:hypothetical protein HPP92_024232 [Vanilla planifolia]